MNFISSAIGGNNYCLFFVAATSGASLHTLSFHRLALTPVYLFPYSLGLSGVIIIPSRWFLLASKPKLIFETYSLLNTSKDLEELHIWGTQLIYLAFFSAAQLLNSIPILLSH